MIEYKLLKEIEQNPASTQRTLAEKLDVSLGKINYVLSGLIKKGLIKAQKLKNDPRNIRWSYLLTPKGISEKITITGAYLEKRLHEFDVIQREIAELKKEVAKNGSGNCD
ncbi:MAG: MarR family EPS-associated transcriptional regulator [Chitinispirillaceae bacterium]|nr:MarR family EPS-associated transcriptional regulator [Chitinispirillaceae bacterium]